MSDISGGLCISISIHAPRAGSDQNFSRRKVSGARISIHAPRAGSDVKPGYAQVNLEQISIHAPRAGSDQVDYKLHIGQVVFQSTLPVRGATQAAPREGKGAANFNPRSPCGERHVTMFAPGVSSDFNPRSPCGERPIVGLRVFTVHYFNPRSPCGERRENSDHLLLMSVSTNLSAMQGRSSSMRSRASDVLPGLSLCKNPTYGSRPAASSAEAQSWASML